jgi:hypothetical protein
MVRFLFPETFLLRYFFKFDQSDFYFQFLFLETFLLRHFFKFDQSGFYFQKRSYFATFSNLTYVM